MTGLLGSGLRLSHSDTDASAPLSILVVAGEPGASHVARDLRSTFPVEVEVLAEWSQCRKILLGKSFSLVLLEGSLAATDPEAVDALYDVLTDGWIVEVDFGVSDRERVVRQVRAALHRKACNEAHTRAAVLRSLRSQLTSCLTGLLLETQLALRQTGPEAAPSLSRILGLAERLAELVQSSGEQHR